jgi:hypothetical protein
MFCLNSREWFLCVVSTSCLVLVLVSGDGDYIDWAQLSRIYLKTEAEYSLRNVLF